MRQANATAHLPETLVFLNLSLALKLVNPGVYEKTKPAALQKVKDQTLFPVEETEPQEITIAPVKKGP